jgi:hypothetical protein
MMKHYIRIADVNMEKAHRKDSPADNWRLLGCQILIIKISLEINFFTEN